jgi:hypothetical protein
MSRLQIPISGKTLYATGDVTLWVDVRLLLKGAPGNWHPRFFRVDSATDVTTFPAYVAKQLGLPMPPSPAQGVSHKPTGLEIRSGYLRFRIVGMDQTEYAVACLFLGDPATAPDPNQPPRCPRNLLQPLAVLDQLRFTLDKSPNDGTPYGTLTVEKK